MSFGLSPVIADHAPLRRGTIAVVRNTKHVGPVFATDTTQTLDKLKKLLSDKDAKAIKKLVDEYHIVLLKNGTEVKILRFDNAEDAYLVQVFGLIKEVWLIKKKYVFAKYN